MQVVPGLFTNKKVALKLLLTQFFSKNLSSQYFFLLWDGGERCGQRNVGFQNGRTRRNAIAFRNILRRKKDWKPGQLKGLHYSLGPTLSGTRPW